MEYFTDYDDFSTIRKRFESAFEWNQNHDNPKIIDNLIARGAKIAEIILYKKKLYHNILD